MGTSAIFDWVCETLEGASRFSTLEARGTIRIALKSAGLDPTRVTSSQMEVVLKKLLPEELQARGVENSSGVCEELTARLLEHDFDSGAQETPENIFARMAG